MTAGLSIDPDLSMGVRVPEGIQGEWFRLVNFLRDTVLIGAAASVISPEEAEARVIGNFLESLKNPEDSPAFTASGRGAERLLADATQGESEDLASIGWPILNFTNARGEQQCTPVFVATVNVSITDGQEVILQRDSSFALNPALAGQDGVAASIVEHLEATGEEVPDHEILPFLERLRQDLNLRQEDFDGSAQPTLQGRTDDVIFNLATVVRGDNAATNFLLNDLNALLDCEDWQNTAAACLVTGTPGEWTSEVHLLPTLAPIAVNDAQESALDAAANQRVTVITGPPGTGKSQVVANLVANAWIREESTLLVSTVNAAVDVATERANDVVNGILLRTGNRSMRDALPDRITQVVAGARDVHPTARATAEANLLRATKTRAAFFALVRKLAELENLQHDEVWNEERFHDALAERGPISLDPAQAHEVLVRARRIAKLGILRGWRWKRLAKRSGLPSDPAARDLTISWLTCLAANDERLGTIQTARLAVGVADDVIRDNEATWALASKEALSAIVHDAISTNARQLSSLGSASAGYNRTRNAIATVLPYLHGWACTTLSIEQNFELKPNLFDTVIVDEASQCSLAQILPAAYRAKRLVVVGDPNQLAPIPSVTSEEEVALALHNGISPGTISRRRMDSNRSSAYDFFANVVGQEAVILLNEHYRCHPIIARWFNETFYGAQLKVLTDINCATPGTHALVWEDVPGEATRPEKGSWVNVEEASRVVALLGPLLESGKSVGVVTPFSAQADRITRLARKTYGAERLGQAKFKSSTSHRFQGDERDVMVFSCVLANGIGDGAGKWVQRERRLVNVAVSRARDALIVVGNPNIADFQCPTLTSLRAFALQGAAGEDRRVRPRFDSEAERRFYEALVEAGVNPIAKFVVEGYELDFGLIIGDRRFDLEVDGDQHYESTIGKHLELRRQDIARDAMLTRAGWTVVRTPAWECLKDPAAAAQRVVATVTA